MSRVDCDSPSETSFRFFNIFLQIFNNIRHIIRSITCSQGLLIPESIGVSVIGWCDIDIIIKIVPFSIDKGNTAITSSSSILPCRTCSGCTCWNRAETWPSCSGGSRLDGYIVFPWISRIYLVCRLCYLSCIHIIFTKYPFDQFTRFLQVNHSSVKVWLTDGSAFRESFIELINRRLDCLDLIFRRLVSFKFINDELKFSF